MTKQFQKQYLITELEDGDRFYLSGDKKKKVYQMVVSGESKHYIDDRGFLVRMVDKYDATKIIFLRHAGIK